jgi:small-conductance mechanosensitive channel
MNRNSTEPQSKVFSFPEPRTLNPRPRFAFCLSILAAGLLAFPARAALTPAQESHYSAERDQARQLADTTKHIAGQTRSNQSAEIQRLETEIQTGRSNLALVQKEWVAQLVRDDSPAIRRIRTESAAIQDRIDVSEDHLALLQKRSQEYEREAGTWQHRAESLDLALRLDLKVLLATPENIANRDSRVGEALKEIDQQRSQIRKYRARRENAFAEIERIDHDLQEVRSALKATAAGTPDAALKKTLENRQSLLLRRIEIQREWAVFNHSLERNAGRNLAFARSDFQILRVFSEALRIKDLAQRAEAAQLRAQQADTDLAAFRTEVKARIKTANQSAAAAAQAAEALLHRISSDASAENIPVLQGDYTRQQRIGARWEAEAAAWDEFLALQKAIAAFAHEQADRLDASAKAGSPKVIEQEERLLRDSLKTSDEYVFSLKALLEKTDRQIETARASRTIEHSKASRLLTSLTGRIQRPAGESLPPPHQIEPDLATFWSELMPTPSEDASATELLYLTFQRALLADRLQLARDWLTHGRTTLAELDRQTTALLWRQSDSRLEWMSLAQLGDFVCRAGADLVFATQVYANQAAHITEYPSLSILLLGGLAGLVLLFIARLGAKRLRRGHASAPGRFLIAEILQALPWTLIGLSVAAVFPFNPGLQILGYTGPVFFVWILIRSAALAGAANFQPPPSASLRGALFCALNTASLILALIAPLYFAAAPAINAWTLQTLLARLALLGICFAFFRLLFHPTLLGRFLSRHSNHILLRLTGGSIAWICIGVCTLAILPRLASLDAFAQSIGRFTGMAFLWLAINLVGNAVLHWGLTRKMSAGVWRSLILRAAQFLLAGVGLTLISLLGWQLINRFLLAPNTPAPVQHVVHIFLIGLQALCAIWHHGIFGGMTVGSLTRGILVFLFFIWLSRRLKSLFLEKVLSRTPMDATTRATFGSILGYLIILLGFVVGLNVAGSSLQNLALLAGAITVGLGFGLQNIINNFVSSLLIHFGRTIRVGDYIDVGGQRGTVREIGFRNTVINTDDGITVLVPNGSFVTANIVNWTNPSRRTRLHIPLVILRTANLADVSELVGGIVRKNPLIVSAPAPTVEVRTVTSANLSIEILAWTETPEKTSAILGELNMALDTALREKGYL